MSASNARSYPPLDPAALAVARTLRAIRAADGEPERQGEEDMEDAMAIVQVMQETIAQSGNLLGADRRADEGHPCCARHRLTPALSPVWPPLLRMTDQERLDFEQLLALVAVARPAPGESE
jgi:hypothetical protein